MFSEASRKGKRVKGGGPALKLNDGLAKIEARILAKQFD
jgi:hypothetical protein